MDYRFDFDDQLPDLPIAFDFDEVATLFERKLFGSVTSPDQAGVLNIKKLQDLKYRPSERCVTTYEMIVGKADTPPERTIGVLEFTPEGVIPRLFTADDRLPWLALATDMNEMQKRFSELPGYDGQIRLLEIFQDGHHGSSDGQAGSIESVDKVGLRLFLPSGWAILNARSPGLK